MTETAQLGDDVASAPLVGRRALVTGGSRGIGAGIVRRLAADGAAVAFTYREAKGPANSLEQEITVPAARPGRSRPTARILRRFAQRYRRPSAGSAASRSW